MQRKKVAAEQDRQQEQVRNAYAKFLENNLLRNDINADVVAYGPKHKYLKLKWVLANKALAFNFTEQRQDLLRQMKSEGYTKFTITDGYEDSWEWNLN